MVRAKVLPRQRVDKPYVRASTLLASVVVVWASGQTMSKREYM